MFTKYARFQNEKVIKYKKTNYERKKQWKTKSIFATNAARDLPRRRQSPQTFYRPASVVPVAAAIVAIRITKKAAPNPSAI
jgi:hypothetical protein